ncbi:efflux RND transporter permease subunit [Candidatus Mcinerneyibacteriota bacterium]|nr:efflux RND transporter permease subunit [Candidatus Mcinerneyibacteriota bacterium]
MSLPNFSVRRPVTTTMIFMAVLLLGFISFKMLNIELLPSIDIPKITVETKAPNMPPEEVDTNVTQKIERQLGTLPNVKKITSISTESKSLITVEFYWGVDMEYTMLKAREKLDNISDDLGDAEKPNILYFDPAQAPIMQIMVDGDYDFMTLSNYASDSLKRRFERLEGVALCDVVGADEEEIQVIVSNRNMVSYGITFNEIQTVLSRNNFVSAAGEIGDENFSYSLSLEKNRYTVEEIGNMKVRGDIRLKDLADIRRRAAELDEYSRFNGKRGIGLLIVKSSSANTVKVASDIRELIASLEQEDPKLNLQVLYDDSETIKNAINNVILSILIGGVLAFFVLFVFLHDFKSPFIIGLSMPLSIIATFITLYLAKISINILSLGGLAIGIGLLVDNSIVVLENMDRYLGYGRDPREASVKGASEVAMAIMAGTLTTIAVFLPVLYLKGVIAVLFKQQAFVISVSLLASLIVALTLVPMVFSRDSRFIERMNRFVVRRGKALFDWFDEILEKGMGIYESILDKALANKKKALLLTLAVLLLTAGLSLFLRREFVPDVKENKFFMEYKLSTGATMSANEKYVKFVESAIRDQESKIDYFVVNLGKTYGNSISGLNTGYFMFAMKSKKLVEPFKQYLMSKLGALEGNITFYSAGSIYNQFFDFGEYDIEVILEGEEIEELNAVADRLKPEIEKIDGFRLVVKDMELEREIIEMRFKDYFIDTIDTPLYTVIEQLKKYTVGDLATTIYDQDKEIDIWVKNEERPPNYDEFMEKIINVDGFDYKIRDIVDMQIVKVPNELKREDQRRKLSLMCNIKGLSLEKAIDKVRLAFDGLPDTGKVKVKFAGKIENMRDSFSGLGFAFILSLILVYMILGVQFESFFQPFVIILAVPLAFIGVFVLMLITNTSLNIMSLMGMVVLVGIVVNDSIVKIDIINRLRKEEGYDLLNAVKTGGKLRFRPILMTSMTTILGLIPLAIGIGEGSELTRPLAVTIIGGLTTSTILTLIIIPVIYTAMVTRLEKHKL